MAKIPEHETMEPFPSPPPLPSKTPEMDESSHSCHSTTSSKKSRTSKKLSSMVSSRLSEGSLKKKQKKIKKSKSFPSADGSDPFLPKSIGKSKSMNAKLDKASNKKKISSKKSSSFSAGESSPKKVSRKVSISDSDDSSQRSSRSSTSSKKSKLSSMIRPLSEASFLSDASLKKKRKAKSKAKNSESELFLPTQIGKSKSMNAKLDKPSSKKKLSSKRAVSFSGEFSQEKVSHRSSTSSAKSEKYRASQKRMSSMSSSKEKEAETKAIMDSLVSSFTTAQIRAAVTDKNSGSATRKVYFNEKVRFKKIDNSEFDRDVMWFSELEILEHRKREKEAKRQSRGSRNLDVEGMFTLQERRARNARVWGAYEAVFDMQLVNKKEKELHDAVGLFAGDSLESDHEAALAEEYMLVTVPAMADAVFRATNLEVHVQLLWHPSNETEGCRVGEAQDASPEIPERKTSNQSKVLVESTIINCQHLLLAQ